MSANRRCDGSKTCYLKNWPSLIVIQKRQWLLSGECVEFPTDYSISDLLEWFLVEVAVMPTALTECNENTTCYALIGIFKILVGERCEHLSELRKLALSCDASLLEDFPKNLSRIVNRLVKNWWTKHNMPYYM
jgi:hypothetical protein